MHYPESKCAAAGFGTALAALRGRLRSIRRARRQNSGCARGSFGARDGKHRNRFSSRGLLNFLSFGPKRWFRTWWVWAHFSEFYGLLVLQRLWDRFGVQEPEDSARRRLAEYDAETQRIRPPDHRCLSWRAHEGEPHMTPEKALRLYREKRSDALSRTVMTDEQRMNFVGDAKPS